MANISIVGAGRLGISGDHRSLPALAWLLALVIAGELALGAVALSLLGTPPSPRPSLAKAVLAHSRRGVDLSPYRGLAAWVDMYDKKPWARPASTVRDMSARGVRSLFLQTSNYHKAGAFYDRVAIEEFIHASHAYGIEVVAWYVPSFVDLERDFERVKAAVKFRTSRGHRFDSFALDIEAPLIWPISLRNQRLIRLSDRIRDMVGPSYTLGAIIPDPVGSDYWRNFPYRAVARRYNVFIPMQYFTFHTFGYEGARAHIAEGIRRIRAATRGRRVPIHVIGGIADAVDDSEMRGFMKALKDANVVGASLYDFPLMGAWQWSHLARFDARLARRDPEDARGARPDAKARAKRHGAKRTTPHREPRSTHPSRSSCLSWCPRKAAEPSAET